MQHWDLGVVALDADLSPDDRLLAVTSESGRIPHKVGEQILVSLELWDYRQRKAEATTQLASYRSSTVQPRPRPVRFTADGSLLAVADGTTVRVLEASTLKLVRLIQPALDPDWEINSVETSPVGHLAIIFSGGYERGHLFSYDLDTGHLLFSWNPPFDTTHSISWKPDGTQFAIAASRPCGGFGDIHVFGTNPWVQVETLKAPNSVSLAFSNDRLYAVRSGSCKGSVFHHHLGMEVFDTKGWKHLNPIWVKSKDIHDFVSFANGRLVADTGGLRTEHNWLDATSWGVATNVQVTVWNGDAESFASSFPISPPVRILKLRLSRTARMLLELGSRPQLFELP